MAMLDAALDDFAREIGLDAAPLTEDGRMALAIDGLGEAHFEKRDDRLVVYLARAIAVGADRLEIFRRALRACHFERTPEPPVACGLHGDRLLVLATLEEGAADGRAVSAALEVLAALQDEAHGVGA